MKRNLLTIGNRSIWGEYNKIMTIGELDIEDSNILKLYSIGEFSIKNSFIKKLRMIGEIKGENVSFDNVNMIGEIDLKGETKADVFVFFGNVKADYLCCRVLRNNIKKSNSKLKSNGKMLGVFKAETYENFASTNLDCEVEFKNIINKGIIFSLNSIECERLYSFGEIVVDEIFADYVYIKPYDVSKVNNINGSNIVISHKFKNNNSFKSLPKSLDFVHYKNIISKPSSIMNVNSIEGDRIRIDHINADLICGGEVIIGDLCLIDRVEYSKSIKISPKAVVNEVVKL